MSMNWSELIDAAEEGGGFEPIPAGDYLALVQDAVAAPATTGKPMVKATFRCLEGPFATRLVWNNFVLSKDNPNALKWFFRHMAVFGMDRSFFALNPSMEAVAARMKGQTVIISVTADREYGGQKQNDVKSLRVANVPGTPPVTPPAETPTPAPVPATETAATGTAPAVPF